MDCILDTSIRRLGWLTGGLCAILGLAVVSCTHDPAPPDTPCGSAPLISYKMPPDIDGSLAHMSEDEAAAHFDCLAWRTFTALNWRASDDARGEPDPASELAGIGEKAVWETYRANWELFQPHDDTWTLDGLDWNDEALPIDCGSNGAVHYSGAVLYLTSQSFLGPPLYDQNDNKVWYGLRVNEEIFDFLAADGYADTGSYSYGGPLPLDSSIAFPESSWAGQPGSLVVKTAWRIISDSDRDHYLTREALLYDKSDSDVCQYETMGLVGFHIMRKVPSSPKWMWATFEHVDNVPPYGTEYTNDSYSFYSQTCADDAPDYCWSALNINESDYACCANVVVGTATSPSQMTRLDQLWSASAVDRAFRNELAQRANPLRYYQLVGSQFAVPENTAATGSAFPDRPCNPNGPWVVPSPGDGDPCYRQVPPRLRNTSMESFFSVYLDQDTQISSDSCMNCHMAGGVDGSYLWHNAMTTAALMPDVQ